MATAVKSAVEFTPDSRQLLTRDDQGHLALWQLGDSVAEGGELGLSLVWRHTGRTSRARAPLPILRRKLPMRSRVPFQAR